MVGVRGSRPDENGPTVAPVHVVAGVPGTVEILGPVASSRDHHHPCGGAGLSRRPDIGIQLCRPIAATGTSAVLHLKQDHVSNARVRNRVGHRGDPSTPLLIGVLRIGVGLRVRGDARGAVAIVDGRDLSQGSGSMRVPSVVGHPTRNRLTRLEVQIPIHEILMAGLPAILAVGNPNTSTIDPEAPRILGVDSWIGSKVALERCVEGSGGSNVTWRRRNGHFHKGILHNLETLQRLSSRLEPRGIVFRNAHHMHAPQIGLRSTRSGRSTVFQAHNLPVWQTNQRLKTESVVGNCLVEPCAVDSSSKSDLAGISSSRDRISELHRQHPVGDRRVLIQRKDIDFHFRKGNPWFQCQCRCHRGENQSRHVYSPVPNPNVKNRTTPAPQPLQKFRQIQKNKLEPRFLSFIPILPGFPMQTPRSILALR